MQVQTVDKVESNPGIFMALKNRPKSALRIYFCNLPMAVAVKPECGPRF